MKYPPGTKGHVVAFGSEDNKYTFDVDADGGTVNLKPFDDGQSVVETPAVEDETATEIEDETGETQVEDPIED